MTSFASFVKLLGHLIGNPSQSNQSQRPKMVAKLGNMVISQVSSETPLWLSLPQQVSISAGSLEPVRKQEWLTFGRRSDGERHDLLAA